MKASIEKKSGKSSKSGKGSRFFGRPLQNNGLVKLCDVGGKLSFNGCIFKFCEHCTTGLMRIHNLSKI